MAKVTFQFSEDGAEPGPDVTAFSDAVSGAQAIGESYRIEAAIGPLACASHPDHDIEVTINVLGEGRMTRDVTRACCGEFGDVAKATFGAG